MLNPGLVVDALVTALQSIPALVTAMSGDATRIYAHHYWYGSSHRLVEAIYKMTPPGILCVFERTVSGNFSGMQIWKHHISSYIRIGNTANEETPISSEDVFTIMMNNALNGATDNFLNIRNVSIMPGRLDLCDIPSCVHLQDEDSYDLFRVDWVMNEIGDQ